MNWLERIQAHFWGTTPEEHTGDLQVTNRSDKKVRWNCGHRFYGKFTLRVYGENLPLLDSYFTTRELCGECFLEQVKKSAIRCGNCGKSIMPGAPVTLYWGDAKRRLPHFKVSTRTPEGGVIGCLRNDCNSFILKLGVGMLYQGNWNGSQFVPAPSQTGGAPVEALGTGRAAAVTRTGRVHRSPKSRRS